MYHQFIVPDYTFLLKIPLKESLKRLSYKKEKKEIYEDKNKITKVLTGYDYLAKRFPKEITEINGNQSVEKVTEEMINKIKLT